MRNKTMKEKLNMGNTPNDVKMGAEQSAKMGAFELAEGMSAEQMMPVYFDKTALREPSIRLYQLNTRGMRYYYYFDSEGKALFMPSVTTILRKVMPENVFLTDWKLGLGKDKAEAYTAERAAYGTFMHACIERLIINRSYNLDEMKGELAKYIEREQLPSDFINYAESLKRDILSFAQFMWDYDIRPYAMEIALFSEKGYAGMIDLVSDIRKYPRSEEKKAREKLAEDAAKAKDDDKKLAKLGEKLAEIEAKYSQRENAIIDFKSGRKGFYEEHEIQLGLYAGMWKEWFPEVDIHSLYNWSPRDWRKAPTYNFKDQTESKAFKKIPYLLDLFALEDAEEKEVTIVGGSIDLANTDNPTSGCISVIPLAELVKIKETEPEDDKPLFEEE